MNNAALPFPDFPPDPRWRAAFVDAIAENAAGIRMQRGQAYLDDNRLLHPEILPGVLTARVQGSQRRPYRVQITTPLVDSRDRRILLSLLREKPPMREALLRGELPIEFGELSRRGGAAIIPRKFRFFCTCPDAPSSPCKHGAALLFMAAEEFGEHPLHLLLWRGLDESWWRELLAPPPLGAVSREGIPREGAREGEEDPLAPASRPRPAISAAAATWRPPAAVPDPITLALLDQLAAPWAPAPMPDQTAQPLCYRLGTLPGDDPVETHTRRLRLLSTELMNLAREEAVALRLRETARVKRQAPPRPGGRRRRRR